MKLFISTTSPFVRKVLVLAREIEVIDRMEIVSVVLTPTAPDAKLSSKNPLGKIPTLELEDGTILFDSRVICSHLLSLKPGHPVQPVARAGLLSDRLVAAADGLLDAGILSRYETVLRPEAYRWSEWIDSQCDKVERSLCWLESNAGVSTTRFELGDIALACSLGWVLFRQPLRDRTKGEGDPRVIAPRLFEWFDAVAERPSMVVTSPK